nr:hypothetical protein [Corallococcus coralloides]
MPQPQPVELTPRRRRALLTQRLLTERLAPEELRGLLAASDPEEVHAALLHLKRRLERLEGGDTPVSLMEALPAALGSCAPESQVLLARLARLLPPEIPLARLKSLAKGMEPLPVDAEAEWLVTAMLREPAKLAVLPGGALLLHAVQRLSPADGVDAEALVDALCGHLDPEVQLEGLRHLGGALGLGLVTVKHALAVAVRALEAPDARVALQAAELLAEPWAARPDLAPPLGSLHGLLERSERLALASLRILARRGDAAALRLVLEDGRRSLRVRREAMALLAPFASHAELRLSLHLSLEDPLLFGPTCAGFLQTLYRRGVRCEPDDVPRVRELFLSNPAITPEVIAEVLSLRQREYVEPLWRLSATDADFTRHLALLRELDGPEAFDLLRALLVRPEARTLPPCVSVVVARTARPAEAPRGREGQSGRAVHGAVQGADGAPDDGAGGAERDGLGQAGGGAAIDAVEVAEASDYAGSDDERVCAAAAGGEGGEEVDGAGEVARAGGGRGAERRGAGRAAAA